MHKGSSTEVKTARNHLYSAAFSCFIVCDHMYSLYKILPCDVEERPKYKCSTWCAESTYSAFKELKLTIKWTTKSNFTTLSLEIKYNKILMLKLYIFEMINSH